jgi:hypothetical protein
LRQVSVKNWRTSSRLGLNIVGAVRLVWGA